MRDWRSEIVWAEPPRIVGTEAPDLVEIKGIYRAQVLAES